MQPQDLADHFRREFPDLVGKGVLVALSGGADSTALVHLLVEADLGLRLEAAYIQHRTRPVESAAELRLCARHCASLHIPFHCRSLLEIDGSANRGREAGWREQRYAALQRLARERGLDAVATGHHRDDTAEGVLVQLLRGAGPRAMAGIAAVTPDNIIRPLLPWTHGQIVAWLRTRSINWCEDSSNRSDEHLRNRVRHHILPVLEEVEPRVRDHLVHLARVLAVDEDFLSSRLEASAPWIDVWHPDGGVPVEALRRLPQALRSRWLHAQAAKLGLPRVSRQQIEAFNRMLDSGTPRAVSLARRWRLRVARGRLWAEAPTPPASYSLTLETECEHSLPIPGWFIRCTETAAETGDHGWSWASCNDQPLQVRPVTSDDRMRGRTRDENPRRLIAKCLPRHLRDAWPGIFIGDTIAWIPGVWMASIVGSRCTRSVEVFRK